MCKIGLFAVICSAATGNWYTPLCSYSSIPNLIDISGRIVALLYGASGSLTMCTDCPDAHPRTSGTPLTAGLGNVALHSYYSGKAREWMEAERLQSDSSCAVFSLSRKLVNHLNQMANWSSAQLCLVYNSCFRSRCSLSSSWTQSVCCCLGLSVIH